MAAAPAALGEIPAGKPPGADLTKPTPARTAPTPAYSAAAAVAAIPVTPPASTVLAALPAVKIPDTEARTGGILAGLRNLLGIGTSQPRGDIPTAPAEFVTAALALIRRGFDNVLAPTPFALPTATSITGTTGTTGTTTKITWAWGSHPVLNFNPATDKLDFGSMRPQQFAVDEVSGSTVIAVVGNNHTYTLRDVPISQLQMTNIVAKRSDTRTRWQNLITAATPPSVSIADASLTEGNSGTSNMAFTVALSKASTAPVTVYAATSNGTATAGSDYIADSGTLTFAAGETSKTITVAVTGDTAVEPDETFTVTLSNPTGATLARAVATGTILNEDVVTAPISRPDAGLSAPFQMPDASTGRTLNVLSYGATPGVASDNDATAIQKAINAAQAGDMVYLPQGTYNVKSTITLKTGVSLVGEGRDLTVLAGSYSSSPHAVIYAAPGVNNLTLSSFTITTASGPAPKAGIRLGLEGGNLVSRVAITDVFIEKFQRFGVQLQNTYQVLVADSVVKNATALDGGGSGYGIIIDQAGSSNNWIRNNEVGPVIRHAILVQESAHHNLIEYNRITGAVSGAIDLHGEDEYSNEIAYNIISDCVRDGTTVSPNGAGIEIGEYSGVIGTTTMHDNSGPYNWVHHNEVYNCSCGLRIMNNSNFTLIEDNVFHDNFGSGIQADLAPLNNLYLLRNSVYNNINGVVLIDVTDAVVRDNIIRDNRDYGLATNSGVTGYVISGNTITGNGVDVLLGSPDGAFEAGRVI